MHRDYEVGVGCSVQGVTWAMAITAIRTPPRSPDQPSDPSDANTTTCEAGPRVSSAPKAPRASWRFLRFHPHVINSSITYDGPSVCFCYVFNVSRSEVHQRFSRTCAITCVAVSIAPEDFHHVFALVRGYCVPDLDFPEDTIDPCSAMGVSSSGGCLQSSSR